MLVRLEDLRHEKSQSESRLRRSKRKLQGAPLPKLSAAELTGLKTRISSLEPVFRV
jgi:hypothetical protein